MKFVELGESEDRKLLRIDSISYVFATHGGTTIVLESGTRLAFEQKYADICLAIELKEAEI